MTHLLGVDAGCRDAAAAEHLLHELEQVLGGAPPLVSTHVVHAGGAHVAVAVSWGPRYAGLAGFEGDPQKLADRVVATIDGAAAVLTVGETSYVGGSATLLEGALEAVGRHRERSEGRLVRLPGGALLVGELTVAEVLGGGFVDAVEGLAGLDVGPSSVLDLGDFVRPTWRDGRCVLLVQAGAGRLVPFEVRDQIPCCHDH